MFLNWGSFWDLYPQLLAGARLTAFISLVSFACAIGVAFLVATGKLSRFRVARTIATIYVEIIRNTPLLLQVYVIFYGLPSLGFRFSPVTASIIGLSLNVGAYLGEIFRAGVKSVPPGQREAATALGMRPLQKLFYIIVPVSLRNIFPAFSNMAVATVLGSSLASVISVAELTGATNEISARTYLTIEVYSFSAVIYLALTLGLSLCLALFERLLFPSRSRG
ncbi:amino acid ABC transporter permease (plasmid) [Agrobacterium leguminum]|uniref:Amino acid ABC transporter, permease n=1 Tax=Agrobacterium deltaense NCPPB 1641 TaxID=1183425 RepID=A0A1S7U9M6_9HYPH